MDIKEKIAKALYEAKMSMCGASQLKWDDLSESMKEVFMTHPALYGNEIEAILPIVEEQKQLAVIAERDRCAKEVYDQLMQVND